jgi:trimeric autotransporter adhesin
MKTHPPANRALCASLVAALLALFSSLNSHLAAAPLGTAFTYQGHLNDGPNPANGLYDLNFALFDVPDGGSQLGLSTTYSGHSVSNGLFTVMLGFGANPFNGEARWLQIQVRTNGGGNTSWTPLTPRQAMTPSPYALYAPNAGSALATANGVVSNLSLAPGAVTSDKIADGTINVADLSPTLASNTFWRLGGNTGTQPGLHFLGTTDNRPVELQVNGQRVLRLESGLNGAPNVVGGSPSNSVAAGVRGATIAGGGNTNGSANRIEGDYGSIGGGSGNTIQTNAFIATIGGGVGNNLGTMADYSAIGGGVQNVIEHDAYRSTIGGGYKNLIGDGAFSSMIGGGEGNTISSLSDGSTISGGSYNEIGGLASSSAIGGGSSNRIATFADYATIPGGLANTAGGVFSLAAGCGAQALHQGTFVWADDSAYYAPYASTGDNQFCVRAAGGVQLSPSTSLFCGLQTRQMLNLWSTNYGVGVQVSTLYFRAGGDNSYNGFAWYRGGSHNDGRTNSGGGVTLMTLNNAGLIVNGVVVSLSDRNLKENFAAASPSEVLNKVTALPISRWNFKGDADTPHVGPMAQDFHAAFGVGTDDKHIATVDADGVALAAIQGLNEKVESGQQKAENRIERLEAENTELKKDVTELRALLNSLAQKVNGGGQ